MGVWFVTAEVEDVQGFPFVQDGDQRKSKPEALHPGNRCVASKHFPETVNSHDVARVRTHSRSDYVQQLSYCHRLFLNSTSQASSDKHTQT